VSKSDHVRCTTDEQLAMLLIRTRPDLWGMSRALKHNRGTDRAKAVWALLDDDEQAILIDIARGRVPASWTGEV